MFCWILPLCASGHSDPGVKDNYDVLFYWLDLQVSDTSTYIRGSASNMIVPVTNALQQVVFDFSGRLMADSIAMNGQKLNYVHNEDELIITLPAPVDPGHNITIQIFYHGLGTNTGQYSGIYNKSVSYWNKRVTWTLSEPFAAMNWFPCKQDLTDKADSVYVFLSTDENLKAGSNGLLTAEVPLPGDRIRYEWKSRFPIAYYLISFAVSDYMDYSFYVKKEGEIDSLLVQNYIYNNTGFLEQNKAAIDKTSDMILLYSGLFGDYPFSSEKYGHCIAPLGGGMEHQTMTTLVSFSFLLVAHELAHQWFGDYVTCSTWQDIWINEGFASYCEYLSYQYLKSQDNADVWIAGVHNYIKSVPGGSVYVPEESADDEDRIFDYRLTYNKGAAIIHMIRQEVGNDSLFFRTLSTFLEKYRNSQASGIDFRNHLEETTGRDFHPFFDQWYFGEGFPIHSFSWDHRNDTLVINSLQTVSASTPFFGIPVEFGIKVNNRDTLMTFRQTNSYNSWKVYLPGTVTSIIVDPHQWLIFEKSIMQENKQLEKEANFRIVPNPARDRINIYYTSKASPFQLYIADASGKVLAAKESDAYHTPVNISRYAPGLYVIIIKDLDGIHQQKFIVY